MLQDAEIRHEGGLFEVGGGARICAPSYEDGLTSDHVI